MTGRGFTHHHDGRSAGAILGSDGSARAHGNPHGVEVAGTDDTDVGVRIAGARFLSFNAHRCRAANIPLGGRGLHSWNAIQPFQHLIEEVRHPRIVRIVGGG